MSRQLIVIGGGAAGFFTAVNAARLDPALEVLVLEKSNKLLSKVKVSGGGRCNVTHACFDISAMSRHYPRGNNFVKKTFHRFFTTDTIEWFSERGVKLKTEPDGRMFPVSDSSQTVIDCLLREANRYGVAIRLKAEVKTLSRHIDKWHLGMVNGDELQADFVCVACGGFPKKEQFNWLSGTGHTIETPVPSLFTFNLPGNPVTRLMGVSCPRATVRIAGSKLQETGPVLITHWGLSGPAVLRLSARAARELAASGYQFTAIINWLPDHHEQSLRELFQQWRIEKASGRVSQRNAFELPQRLWEFFLQQCGIAAETRWADLTAVAQNRLAKWLCAAELPVSGKTTFKEEFVTAGGVRLQEIDPLTMESRLQPGLYFAGEIMDVDGVTGGFNFQHAWTSGFIAAVSIAEKKISGPVAV